MVILSGIQYIHPTIYSLIVSLLLAIWYNGISGAINYFLPDRGIYIISLMLILPIIIFLLHDGNLDELYSSPSAQYPIIAGATDQNDAQIRSQQAQRVERFIN